MKRKLFIIPFLGLLCCKTPVGAQNVKDWIKAFNPEKVSYLYEAALIDNKTHKVLDKLQGKMYVLRNRYLDSNSAQINGYDGARSLQIDFAARSVILKSYKKFTPDNSSQKVLFDLGAIVKDHIREISSSRAANGDATITLQLADPYLQEVNVTLDSRQYLKELRFTMLSDGGSATRVLVMKDFDEAFPSSAIALHRFFSGSTYRKLGGAYSNFELKNIIL